jgi:thiol-disulfide isomerase/thioredoxin
MEALTSPFSRSHSLPRAFSSHALGKTITWVAFALLVCCGPRHQPSQKAALRNDLGPAAPPFSLKDLQGNIVSSAALKGKITLIDLWASWCPPCIASMPDIERLQHNYQRRGLVVVGVTLDDDDAKLRTFLAHHPANFSVVKPNAAFNVDYGRLLQVKGGHLVGKDKLIWASLPSWILIDRQGRVSAIHKSSTEEKQVLAEAASLASRSS